MILSSTEKIFETTEHRIFALGYNPQIESVPIIFIHGITASDRYWEQKKMLGN